MVYCATCEQKLAYNDIEIGEGHLCVSCAIEVFELTLRTLLDKKKSKKDNGGN